MSKVIKMLLLIIMIYGECERRNISNGMAMTDSRFGACDSRLQDV